MHKMGMGPAEVNEASGKVLSHDLWQKATPFLSRFFGTRITGSMDLIRLAQQGIDPALLDRFVEQAAGVVAMKDMTMVIARRTLSDRKNHGERLKKEESERFIRLAKVVAMAEAVFGSKDKARKWLHKENKDFSGMSALELIHYEEGSAVVEDYLRRLDAGFYA